MERDVRVEAEYWMVCRVCLDIAGGWVVVLGWEGLWRKVSDLSERVEIIHSLQWILCSDGV